LLVEDPAQSIVKALEDSVKAVKEGEAKRIEEAAESETAPPPQQQ
jgi:hypothetical protein